MPDRSTLCERVSLQTYPPRDRQFSTLMGIGFSSKVSYAPIPKRINKTFRRAGGNDLGPVVDSSRTRLYELPPYLAVYFAKADLRLA